MDAIFESRRVAAALTEGQVLVLTNLARRSMGEAAPFVNIADARRLTELGLAARNPGGWEITAEGAAALHRRLAPDETVLGRAPASEPIPLRRDQT